MIKKSNLEIINRAKNYPYQRPKGSFLLENERIVELKGRVLDGDLSKFIPVLAYGSNASPEQLRRKLSPINEPIAVLSATVKNLDVIFSGQFSRYGCVPATITKSEGTMLYTHVVLLNKKQLSIIHKTELPEYRYGKLKIPIIIDRLGFRESIFAYVFDWGFKKDNKFIAFDEIYAENRNFLTLNHKDFLSILHNEIMDKASNLDGFLISIVENRGKLDQYREYIKSMSQKITLNNFIQILPKEINKN